MKNIQIKKLKLTNYRNIKYAEYDFDGDSMIIGDNRIGKTNTLESIYYLLTDSLLNNSNDIAQIKPLEDTSRQVRVEATFDIDGKQLTLAKEYEENWTKTRGTTELVFKGHSTTYYYNGVKQSTLKEYNRYLAEDFGFENNDDKIDFTKLLIDPYYLGEIGESKDWSNLRTFIIKLIGDVNDDDVFAHDESLLFIKEDLSLVNGRTDLLKKSLKSDVDSLKEQIISTDGQIKLLEETSEPNETEVALARKGIEDIDARINDLKQGQASDTASQKIEDDIRKVETELLDLKRADFEKQDDSQKVELQKELRSKQDEVSFISEQRTEIVSKITREEYLIKDIKNRISNCIDKRTALVNDVRNLDKDVKDIESKVDKECPLCHHQLDENEVAEKIETLKKEYADKRAELIEQGKANNVVKANLEEELAKEEKLLAECESSLKDLESQRSVLADKIDNLQQTIDSLEISEVKAVNPKIAELSAVKESLNKKLSDSRNLYLNAQKNTNSAIYELEQQKEPYKKVLDDLSYAKRCKENLDVVYKKKRDLQQTLADKEQKNELIKKFIYVKLQMLDENVAKVFGNIKFQLIRENINGGYDAICKPYIYDSEKDVSTNTTWKSGSKSERVITGIAIAEKIKIALNLPNLPYLFDEGGEISTNTFASKFKTDSQIICVKVVDNVAKPVIKSIQVNSK